MPRHLLRTCIWGAACVSWAALAQHPHALPPAGPHEPLPISPNFLPTLPVAPDWPAEPFPPHPGNISRVIDAPGIGRDYREMPPMLPAHLSRQDPSPADLKRIVAEHARQTGKTHEGDEVTVEISKGGYLVTRSYKDPTSPCCIWEFTFFVSDSEVADKKSQPPETETTRPPGLPPSGPGRHTRPDPIRIKFDEPLKLDPIIVKPGDITELNDPAALEKKLREISFEGTLIQDEFTSETQAIMEEIMAAAGQATLETGLTVGSVLPVAGTVIAAGEAFTEQYAKTRDTLLKNGVSPADAHQQALLQATAVAGVAAGADLATGSVLGKLKAAIRNPLLQSALRDKHWSKEAATRLGQGIDLGVDATAAYLLTAGGEVLKNKGGNGQPPALPPAYGADRNGLLFLER